jgi:hypothetical protein
MSAANPSDVLANLRFGTRGATQRKPVLHLATGDHIIDRSKRKALMIEMPVLHAFNCTANVMT